MKLIAPRFSNLQIERIEKYATEKDITQTEAVRMIVDDYFDKQKQESKFEQVNLEIQQLRGNFREVVKSNIDLVKGFHQLAAIVQQKQGA